MAEFTRVDTARLDPDEIGFLIGLLGVHSPKTITDLGLDLDVFEGRRIREADDQEWIAELDRADRQINDLILGLVEIRGRGDVPPAIVEIVNRAIEERFRKIDD